LQKLSGLFFWRTLYIDLSNAIFQFVDTWIFSTQEYEQKQSENQWRDKLGIGPAHAPNPILTTFGMWGDPRDVFLKFEFQIGRSPNFGVAGGVKNRPFQGNG